MNQPCRRYPKLHDFIVTTHGNIYRLEGFTAAGILICRVILFGDECPDGEIILIHPDHFFSGTAS